MPKDKAWMKKEDELQLFQYEHLMTMIEMRNTHFDRMATFFFTAISIYVAGLFLILNAENETIDPKMKSILVMALSVIAIITLLFWIVLGSRSQAKLKYRMKRTRDIEAYFKQQNHTFDIFSDSDKVFRMKFWDTDNPLDPQARFKGTLTEKYPVFLLIVWILIFLLGCYYANKFW